MKKIIVGITGASGSIFAHRFITSLLSLGHEVNLVVTPSGKSVCLYELEKNYEEMIDEYQTLKGQFDAYSNDDFFSKIASGSYKADAMVIIPCSMGTVSKVANGISDNLLTRAADVMIKEQRRLMLITRESPLSSIHLENMLKLSRIGVTIMPPVPAFYNKPKTLDDSINLSVGRMLESLDIENPFHKIWGESNE